VAIRTVAIVALCGLWTFSGCVSAPKRYKPLTAADCPTSADEPPIVSPILTVPPQYPQAAFRKGVQGRVLMEATILPDGSVRDVEVVESEPPGVFDGVATHAFAKWRYCPLLPGQAEYPNPVRIAIPFSIRYR